MTCPFLFLKVLSRRGELPDIRKPTIVNLDGRDIASIAAVVTKVLNGAGTPETVLLRGQQPAREDGLGSVPGNVVVTFINKG